MAKNKEQKFQLQEFIKHNNFGFFQTAFTYKLVYHFYDFMSK